MVEALRRLSDFLYWIEGVVDRVAGWLLNVSNNMVEKRHSDGADHHAE